MQSFRASSSGLRTLSQQRSLARIYLNTTNTRNMSGSQDLGIENTNIRTAQGVTLSDSQKTIVGSVLDLFAGRPTKQKLQLWKDDAIFEDNITVAKGRQQYEPQWYGLEKAFSEIERLSHVVTSSGNPITMDMKTRYVVAGIKQEKTIDSKINIYTEGDKITHVQDKWDGTLPEGGIKDAFRRLNANTVPKMVSVPKE